MLRCMTINSSLLRLLIGGILVCVCGLLRADPNYAPEIGPPMAGEFHTIKQQLWFKAAKAELHGDWAGVLRVTQQWLYMRPSDVEPLIYQARAHANLDNAELALKQYQQVVSRFPEEDFLFLEISRLQMRLGEHTQACWSINKALTINPEYMDALDFHDSICNKVSDDHASTETTP